MAIMGGLVSYFENRSPIERLKEYGYIPDEVQEEYNRENTIKHLWELCEITCTEEPDLILWCERGAEEEIVCLGYPVMLATLLEEYDCVERLMDMGYQADDRMYSDQIYMKKRGEVLESYTVSITQLLIAREDIPKRLLDDIFEELFCCFPIFSFETDYWNNPFLCEVNDSRSEIPDLRGLTMIHQYYPEELEGMLEGEKLFSLRHQFNQLQPSEWKKLVKGLYKCFEGLEDDLSVLNLVFTPQVSVWGIIPNEEALKFWMKELPNLQQECGKYEQAGRVFFEQQLRLLGEILKHKVSVQARLFERCSKLLTAIVEQSCPEDYNVADFMEYLLKNKDWQEYKYELNLWKKYVKKTMVVDRADGAFWTILQRMFGEKCEEPELILSDENRNNNRETRISESIAFMEMIEEVTGDYPEDEDIHGLMVNLLCDLMDFNSEELVMACFKNNLVPKELAPILATGAIRYNHLRIVPAVIMFQNQR